MVERDLNDLTLAEKIKLEQQQKQSRQTSLASTAFSQSKPADKPKPVSQPAPPITDELYPPLAPGLALFKSAPARPSASGPPKGAPKHSSQIGGWDTALSSTGLEDTRKKKKKGSGLTVVKPKSPVPATPTPTTPTVIEQKQSVGAMQPPPPPPPPPPGFADMVPTGKLHRDQLEGQGGNEFTLTTQKEMKFDPSDYPSLSGGKKTATTANRAAASWGPSPPAPKTSAAPSKNSLKPTEDSSSNKFPGSWVSIGGSRGVGTVESVQVQRETTLTDDDFPSLGGGGSVEASGKKAQKKKVKATASKDLQSLAFGTK